MTGHRPLIAAGGPGGPLGRYVTDPGGTTARLARLLLHALAARGPAAGPVLAIAAAAVIANSATQILLRQSPQAITKVAAEFRLSAGERALLLSAARGTGLLAAGPSARVSFEALASPEENAWCTSDPAEIARLQPAAQAAAPTLPDEADEDMLP